MAQRKTHLNDASVEAFLGSVPEKRQADCRTILRIMGDVTGEPPKMWGKSIIGFGTYEYQYANGKPASFFLAGFSPRKQNLVLYVMGGFEAHEADLAKLGKHRTGKACLYVNKLADIDLEVLERIVRRSAANTAEKHRRP